MLLRNTAVVILLSFCKIAGLSASPLFEYSNETRAEAQQLEAPFLDKDASSSLGPFFADLAVGPVELVKILSASDIASLLGLMTAGCLHCACGHNWLGCIVGASFLGLSLPTQAFTSLALAAVYGLYFKSFTALAVLDFAGLGLLVAGLLPLVVQLCRDRVPSRELGQLLGTMAVGGLIVKSVTSIAALAQ